MDTLTYFKLLTQDAQHPCYFTHLKTHMLCYANPAMEQLLEKTNLVQGNSCFEMLHGRQNFCSSCVKSKTKKDSVISYPLTVNGQRFQAHCSIISYQDQDYMLSKYMKESHLKAFQDYGLPLSDAMSTCAEILTESDLNPMIQRFLELLAQFHRCEQVYIFSVDSKEGTIHGEYDWKEQDNLVQVENLEQSNLVKEVISYLKSRKKDGFSFVRLEEEDLIPETVEYILFHTYQIKNLVSVPLYNESAQLVGSIELLNLRTKGPNRKLLSAVCRFLEESLFQKRMTENLVLKTNVDELTGFYNHYRFMKDIQVLEQEKSRCIGVICVNVNGLSKANIYFGVEASDIQIKRSAEILRQFFPEDCYRLSGDDFVCFVPDLPEETFHKRVKELQDNLKQSGQRIFSVGYAWRKHSYDMLKIVSIADTMMHINKQEYYNLTFGTDLAPVQDDLLEDLLLGIKEEQFLVYFQPKVELATGLVIGAEALVRRLDAKNNKLIFPDSFIPNYEEHSIIRHIDLYVLDKVCSYLQKWNIHQKKLTISINLSRVTLLEHDILNTIIQICDKYDISHETLIIEVTERVGLMENELASSLVDEFKSQGFKLALDDFGCAYSNIVTLALINVDEVKLDKSLVDNIATNPQNKIIVENVLNMVNQLEDSVTLAEGIEDFHQAQTLRDFHCTYGQGYFYSRPISAEDFYHNFILPTEQVILQT